MNNILVAILASALLVTLFRKKYKELALVKKMPVDEMPAPAIQDVRGAPEILPVKKKPLPRNFAEVNASFRKGETEFSRGKIDDAERWFVRTLALFEHHEEALNRLGVIAIQKGESLKAELLYRRLLSLNLKEPAYYCNYGRALYNQEKFSEAVLAYEMAIKLDPTKANRFKSLGQIYYELGKNDRALETFLEAHRLEPRNFEYLGLITDLYETMGRWDELHGFLGKMLVLDPYDERVAGRIRDVEKKREPVTQTVLPLQ